ncbi:MAG: hypothetical protein KDD82_16095 [Planctomycetes bacterium]|nr:hypothetical protein [Planctomycetota bacterium]
MTASRGVAFLVAGGVALLAGTAIRALASRAALDDDQRRGARRLIHALHGVAGALLLVGVLLVSLA